MSATNDSGGHNINNSRSDTAVERHAQNLTQVPQHQYEINCIYVYFIIEYNIT